MSGSAHALWFSKHQSHLSPSRWAKIRLNLREPWVCWASSTQNQPFPLFLLGHAEQERRQRWGLTLSLGTHCIPLIHFPLISPPCFLLPYSLQPWIPRMLTTRNSEESAKVRKQKGCSQKRVWCLWVPPHLGFYSFGAPSMLDST